MEIAGDYNGAYSTKYGGTSVANTERIKAVAERAVSTAVKGNQVIIVVSAMAGETDKLIKFAHEITDMPDEREMDLLLSSERKNNKRTYCYCRSKARTQINEFYRQAGRIITDSSHTKAMIEHMKQAGLKPP